MWTINFRLTMIFHPYLKCQIVTSPYPNSWYRAIIVCSKQTHWCKSILSHFIQSLVHSWKKIKTHLLQQNNLHENKQMVEIIILWYDSLTVSCLKNIIQWVGQNDSLPFTDSSLTIPLPLTTNFKNIITFLVIHHHPTYKYI